MTIYFFFRQDPFKNPKKIIKNPISHKIPLKKTIFTFIYFKKK